MNSPPPITIRRHASRRASILVCVLVCLAVSTALVTSTVRSALTARRTMRTEHHLRQTELLLAAGVQRAAAQLESDPNYTGETWRLSSNALPGIETAQVQIDLASAEDSDSRQFHVTARLLIAERTAIQRSYSFPLEPQLSSDKE